MKRIESWTGLLLTVGVTIFGGTAQSNSLEIANIAEHMIAPSESQNVPGKSPVSFQNPPGLRRAPEVILGQGFVGETEPNGTFGTANPLGGSNVVVRGNVYPNADVDWYSFTAAAGDRVYAATMTSFSANASSDSEMRLFQSDGTTLIENDSDDGTLGGLASSIAGAAIAAPGTYFLEVRHFSATNQIRPYELHFRLQSGSPTPEVEPNDTPATANPLPASGWVSGARNPAVATEQDWYSFTAAAGDTVYLSLNLDPERDNVQWNGRLGIALFGDANNQILVLDDASTGSVANPLSEALFFTVKTAGTYFAFVDSATAATGGPTATYDLSVSIHPAVDEGVNCTTYTSTNVPQTIGPGAGLVSSTITVPGNPRIADLDVDIQLNHALMGDIDAHLRSPAGNDNGLFTDIGAAATGGQTMMDVLFDDEAGVPPVFTVLRPIGLKPELAYRLSWFDGEDAGGTWTLDLRDDTANASGGTLTAWSLRICEPPPPPACPPGFAMATAFSTDFEAGDAGFTHSGVTDEWERGLPTFAPINTCNSGANCWKTDLDNTYNAGVAAGTPQDLLSPAINLAGFTAPVVVRWAQKYQIENATFDRAFVDFQQVGGTTPIRLFEWLDATMTNTIGSPAVTIQESSGWSQMSARADALAGLNTELRFNLTTDNTVQLAGLAIDDVSVTACRALSADLSITKTDGVATATPGGSVTYTITASNAGPDPVTGGTVADTFPASLTCTWTCVGAGGGTCTAAGAGNIADTVNLPSGGSTTYTASCTIAASATGSLVNTATVSSAITDPTPGDNSATDTDTLTPQADLAITKTDGVVTANPGGSVTYTIVASNAGPSDAPGSTVADTFPASLTCTWTCAGAGGGACTAAGSGNISDTANLPAGGSATYTASCTISGAATGTLVNTATVTAAGGITDPTPGNNSATDTDTLAAVADLSITKTDGVASVAPGGTLTYTIVASNAGPSNATGASVADTFPASLTCSWTCVGAGGGTCTAGGAGNIADTVNLPSGGSVTYTASCTVSGAASGTIDNTATVTAPGGVTDPTPGNNSATDSDMVILTSDLSITKTDGVTTVGPGGTLTYTIVAGNTGPQAANGATVADTFPAECTTVSWTCAGAGGATCTAAGSGTINDTVNLPAAGAATYTAICSVSGAATNGTVISNTATVTIAGGGSDPVPGNNSATDTTTVAALPDVTGTKTVAGAFSPGGAITYTITLSNSGAGAQADNPGDEFVDVLPASLTLVSANASAGTAVATIGTNTVNWNGSIAAAGSVTIIINATINPTAIGTITNQGTINFDGDGNGTNETARLTDDPAVGGAANPTAITVVGISIPVPTLSTLALVALSLMVLGLGLRRRLV